MVISHEGARIGKRTLIGVGTENGVRPIFVPGIAGSELRDLQGNEKYPRANEVYYDTEGDTFLLDISLDENGNEVVETEPGNILRSLPVDYVPDPDIYETTIKTLTDAGYVEGEDLFVFPYDWRKDVEHQGQNELIAKINEILENPKFSRVDILAHSQGGLVTLAALRDPDSIGKVRKVRTLGTPLLGATKTLGLLEYRLGCFGAAEIFSDECIIDPVTTQQIMKYMPGTYQLLPSRKFDEAVGAPLVVDLDSVDDGEKHYGQWTAEVTEGSNVSARLLAQTGEFHARYDFLTLADPLVKLVRVVGTGKATPTYVLRYNNCDFIFFSCEVEHKLVEEDTGDGTVPEGSADPGGRYDPRNKTDTVYVDGVEHGDLARDPEILAEKIEYFRPEAEQASLRSSRVVARPYEGPFIVPSGTFLRFLSVDRAGTVR